jgi:hypothetical protein
MTSNPKMIFQLLPAAVLVYYFSVANAFSIVVPSATTTTKTATTRSVLPCPHHVPTATSRVTTRRIPSSSSLHGIFGFGGGNSSADPKDKIDAVLGSYDITADNVDVAFNSLSDYIQNKWIGLFDNENIKLTTPVVIEKFEVVSPSDEVHIASGVRLLFQKKKADYKSKKDEVKDEQKQQQQQTQDKKKKRDDEPNEGGVEIVVEKLSGNNKLRVRAKRCEVDEDTLIKEMSEETILSELKTAIDVWKKDIRPKQ